MGAAKDSVDSVAAETRALAARRGLTQGDLAQAIGRSQSYVSRALHGGRSFDVRDLEGLAALFQAAPSRLMGAVGSDVPGEESEALWGL